MTASGTSHIKACDGHAGICPAIAVAELEQMMLQGDPATESINQHPSSLATVHYLLSLSRDVSEILFIIRGYQGVRGLSSNE